MMLRRFQKSCNPTEDSIKRAEHKFIAVIVSIVALILIVVFTIICVLNAQQAHAQVRDAMNGAISSAHDMQHPQQNTKGNFDIPQLGRPHSKQLDISVAVYKLVGAALVPAERTRALLYDDVLTSIQAKSLSLPEGYGTIKSDGLLYVKRITSEGTYIAFVDVSAVEGWKSLALTFLLVGIGALAVFFCVSIALARWALKPVRIAWEKQKAFVSDASHELKTPLSVIIANTDIVLDEPDLDEAARTRWLTSTKEAAQTMRQLIEAMLELGSIDERGYQAQTESSNESTSPNPVDVSRLVNREALKFESVAFERGFTLDVDIATDVYVCVSEDSLLRIIQILLDNACKYVDEGGSVKLSLFKDSASEQVTISVMNTGATIPLDKLPHIFDRFYRVDEARDTHTGHGLGLSIASALAGEMGATLSAKSKQGETTFTLVVSKSANA